MVLILLKQLLVLMMITHTLAKDKEYQLLGVTDRSCMINDDEGYEIWASMQRFETVPDNNISKSDKTNQIFKVGDKAYVGLTGRVAQVTEIVDDDVISVANKHNEVRAWVSNICHATQENYEMLCKLYPHIEFELPPKEITGSDLCCSMLRDKHTNIMCQADGDETNIRIITLYTGGYFYDRSGNRYSEVIPIDTKGIPLTDGVLNDIN